ncbi:hypothetical protein [Clostridium taeniosporum]|uniref:hypothetical protein n=1 Tax=Clostridium taeniosporum TaxID=394958 RepID=UPI001FA92619|nr:hypothetical protein [Clostridium taeniosporum]
MIEFDWNILKDKMGIFCMLTVISAISILLVTNAWANILNFIEYKDVSKSTLSSVYIKANIAKYLPGNVMNLIGRNVMAGKLGFKQTNITISTIIEIIFFAFTTIILSLIFSIHKIKYIISIIYQYINFSFIISIIIIIFILLIVITVYKKYIYVKTDKYIKQIKKFITLDFAKLSIKLFILYALYFFILGCLLVIVINNVLNIKINLYDASSIIGFYVLSFFIGYITPGAPGGIGIRDTVIIVLLSSVVGTSVAIISSLIHRIITIVGDIIIFLFSYIIFRKQNNS